MRKIKIIVAMFLVLCCSALSLVPVLAYSRNPICDMENILPEAKEDANCSETETIFSKVPGAVTAVFSVVGILAVMMVIYGGARYAISQGDPGKTKKAKDTIMYAVIGLIVTLLAFGITTFIMGAL